MVFKTNKINKNKAIIIIIKVCPIKIEIILNCARYSDAIFSELNYTNLKKLIRLSRYVTKRLLVTVLMLADFLRQELEKSTDFR